MYVGTVSKLVLEHDVFTNLTLVCVLKNSVNNSVITSHFRKRPEDEGQSCSQNVTLY
jgi:hypothetical protein